MNKIFVYGTLKSGYHNDGFLAKARFLGEAMTMKDFTLLTNHYTGLPYVIKEASYPIEGELYEVDEWTFMTIDNLEGHPHFYCRELVDLEVNNKKERGWLYFLMQDYQKKK